jgi:hypothetical protein
MGGGEKRPRCHGMQERKRRRGRQGRREVGKHRDETQREREREREREGRRDSRKRWREEKSLVMKQREPQHSGD